MKIPAVFFFCLLSPKSTKNLRLPAPIQETVFSTTTTTSESWRLRTGRSTRAATWVSCRSTRRGQIPGVPAEAEGTLESRRWSRPITHCSWQVVGFWVVIVFGRELQTKFLQQYPGFCRIAWFGWFLFTARGAFRRRQRELDVDLSSLGT